MTASVSERQPGGPDRRCRRPGAHRASAAPPGDLDGCAHRPGLRPAGARRRRFVRGASFLRDSARGDDPVWADRDRFLLSTAHNSAIFYARSRRTRPHRPARLALHADGSGSRSIVRAARAAGRGRPVARLARVSRSGRHGARCAGAAAVPCLCVLGDGELQEGQVVGSGHGRRRAAIANLCLIIDLNAMQVEGHVDRVLD